MTDTNTGADADPDVDVRDDAFETLVNRSDYLTAGEFVSVVERHHPEGSGVDRGTLAAYAEQLGSESAEVDAEALLSSVEESTVDSTSWTDEESLYRIDGRYSAYPAEWHDRLGGDDPREYVAVLSDALGDDRGVPESTLLGAMSAIGGVDRDTAKANLEALREDGELVKDADQHPDGNVYLAENAEEMAEGKDVQ